MTSLSYDVAVVGAGIIGLATARAILFHRPTLRLVVVEKESKVAVHQSGHNSGVIHSGIYYRPGSLKAQLCVEGARQMTAFCDRHDILYDRCGKLIVATTDAELLALQTLFERGQQNGVPGLQMLGPVELRKVEPHAMGVGALHSPSTAIVDYRQVARALQDELTTAGAEVVFDTEIRAIRRSGEFVRLESTSRSFQTRLLINCAGLHADTIARMTGATLDIRIIPFRGEYYLLRPESRHLVNGLIYPVPDPALPFLGVHFTRRIDGTVEVGPNAVLAFAREGYSHRQVNGRELGATLVYPGFRRLARRFWRTGLYEMYRSLSKAAFVRSLQSLVPEIQSRDLGSSGAGVRAQAVDDLGRLVDDFHIVKTRSALHVLNAPSPAATASLAIGDRLARQALDSLALAG